MGTPFIPELAELLRQVEQKFAHRLSTTTDYELLSFVIEREMGELVSASTLKRLWGYVSYSSTPRIATLDTLSRYVGQKDFKSFRLALKDSGEIVSTFFTTKTIEVSDLEEGARLLLGWAPNRLIRLKFLGGTTFEVESVENAKLRPGDRFDASEFILGAPLFLATIRRSDGTNTPPYVAAKAEGLNVLEVMPGE
ncbi:MAG: hypothetical protein IKW89_12620 [Bacteroidales bacterium]|nr:hypothetical protein [Bacteroidales bacterium]